jgi:hypothetical protein
VIGRRVTARAAHRDAEKVIEFGDAILGRPVEVVIDEREIGVSVHRVVSVVSAVARTNAGAELPLVGEHVRDLDACGCSTVWGCRDAMTVNVRDEVTLHLRRHSVVRGEGDGERAMRDRAHTAPTTVVALFEHTRAIAGLNVLDEAEDAGEVEPVGRAENVVSDGEVPLPAHEDGDVERNVDARGAFGLTESVTLTVERAGGALAVDVMRATAGAARREGSGDHGAL